MCVGRNKSVYFGWDLASDDDDEKIELRSRTQTREHHSVVDTCELTFAPLGSLSAG